MRRLRWVPASAPPEWLQPQRRANQANRSVHIAYHQLRRNAQSAVPSPSEHAISPCVRVPTREVRAPIHLDNEPRLRREKISDVTPANRHLPAKRNAELAGPKRAPEPRLRRREHLRVGASIVEAPSRARLGERAMNNIAGK